MAKVKPEIPVGKFVILDRVNKQGETTIHLRFHWDGYVKRSTGIGIPPSAWDENKCCVKPSYPQAAKINSELQSFKNDIDKKLLAYEGEITKKVLNFILNGGDPMALPPPQRYALPRQRTPLFLFQRNPLKTLPKYLPK